MCKSKKRTAAAATHPNMIYEIRLVYTGMYPRQVNKRTKQEVRWWWWPYVPLLKLDQPSSVRVGREGTGLFKDFTSSIVYFLRKKRITFQSTRPTPPCSQSGRSGRSGSSPIFCVYYTRISLLIHSVSCFFYKGNREKYSNKILSVKFTSQICRNDFLP